MKPDQRLGRPTTAGDPGIRERFEQTAAAAGPRGQHARARQSLRRRGLSGGDLAALGPLRLLRDRVEYLLAEHARLAHDDDGNSWHNVGAALGVTGSAAAKRYGPNQLQAGRADRVADGRRTRPVPVVPQARKR